jgi:hypothetical protein
VFTSKVDALVLYMAQLKERIEYEQQQRGELMRTYEQSLNTGVVKLGQEAQDLSQNYLVREISLVVARQLMKQNGGQLEGLPQQQLD